MPIKFTSREKRDKLAERLLDIANRMQRSFDQGHDGRIAVTDEMIGDIETAVAVVGCSGVFTVEEIEIGEKAYKEAIGSAQSRGPLGLD